MALSMGSLMTIWTNEMNYLMLLYTDPGTGTLILQLLIAAFFGAFFYIRFFTRRARSFFFRQRKPDANSDNPQQTDLELNKSADPTKR
jgi:hypothetical protein